jgi:hypothetical protein
MQSGDTLKVRIKYISMKVPLSDCNGKVNMTAWLSYVALCVGALLLPPASFSAAIDFTSAPVAHDTQLTLGFVFTTNANVEVTSLGYYDEGQDGFITNHEIGIFNSNGQLLISTILSAGSASHLDGLYRYRAVTPITLSANETFTVAATTGGNADGYAFGTNATISGFVVDPSINVASDAARFIYQNDDILRLPSNAFVYTIYGAPNFNGRVNDISDVPEPATATLALSALAALQLWRRKKQ